MDALKKAVRGCIGSVLRVLPPGTPEFVYRTLLGLPPLRAATNSLLKLLLPEHVQLEEGTLRLNPTDPVISGALALGVYEPYETSLYRKLLAPGMTVLDVGANIGLHMLIAAHRVGKNGTVIAIEPEPDNFKYLERNVRENNLQNVRACAVAAADQPGILTLHLSDANKGKHSLVGDQFRPREFSKTVPVEACRIDDLLAAQNVTHVDLVKMDVEGAEPLALAGMPQVRQSPTIILFIEFSPGAIVRAGLDPHAMLAMLETDGFTLYEIREEERRLLPVVVEGFAERFTGEEYANLLCSKAPLPSSVTG